MRSPPATLLVELLRPLELKTSGASRSCTATLGTCGTGNFRWDPSGLLMISERDMPVLGPLLTAAGADVLEALGNCASG